MELPTVHEAPQPTRPLQTASLATFRGDALTDLLAGLAANSMGSFVKAFTPLRASVAGLFTIDILTKPGMTNSPVGDATELKWFDLNPHGSVKQIHYEELEAGEKERPCKLPWIMLKQADSGIEQLHAARERAQD